MLFLYIGLATVGLVLLGASLLGAGHDHGGGHEAESSADGSGEGHASPVAALLSVRVWTYFLAFGGLTGALLRLVAHAGEPRSALGALAVGAAAATMARLVLTRAAQAGSSGTVQARDLVGRTGGVIVPFAAGATGKVRVRVAGADVDVLAVADPAEALGRDDEVLIVELREGGTAVVTRSPSAR